MISIILPTFNRDSIIASSVECVLSQSFIEYELIVRKICRMIHQIYMKRFVKGQTLKNNEKYYIPLIKNIHNKYKKNKSNYYKKRVNYSNVLSIFKKSSLLIKTKYYNNFIKNEIDIK